MNEQLKKEQKNNDEVIEQMLNDLLAVLNTKRCRDTIIDYLVEGAKKHNEDAVWRYLEFEHEKIYRINSVLYDVAFTMCGMYGKYLATDASLNLVLKK